MSAASTATPRQPISAFRNRRGEPAASVTASEAKKQFGRVLETVLQGGTVVITRHNAPKAIIVSVDEFNALTRSTEGALGSLSADFDAMLARMQSPKSRAAMKAAFGALPKRLGRAAVAAARKRS